MWADPCFFVTLSLKPSWDSWMTALIIWQVKAFWFWRLVDVSEKKG